MAYCHLPGCGWGLGADAQRHMDLFHPDAPPVPNPSLRTILKEARRRVHSKVGRTNEYASTGTRINLHARQRGCCGICWRPGEQRRMNIDHIVPRSRGGPNTRVNLRLTHVECNHARGSAYDDAEKAIWAAIQAGKASDYWTDVLPPLVSPTAS